MEKITLFLVLLALLSGCNNKEEVLPAKGIVERIAPKFAGDILFEQIESPEGGKDVFELESSADSGGKVLIRGNSPISMAMGFNHYLKYYCKKFLIIQ